jgi:hypothetical protein
MIPCEVRERLEDQINEAYKELAEVKYESPQSEGKAQAKVNVTPKRV